MTDDHEPVTRGDLVLYYVAAIMANLCTAFGLYVVVTEPDDGRAFVVALTSFAGSWILYRAIMRPIYKRKQRDEPDMPDIP